MGFMVWAKSLGCLQKANGNLHKTQLLCKNGQRETSKKQGIWLRGDVLELGEVSW